jgi:hypothetical protein
MESRASSPWGWQCLFLLLPPLTAMLIGIRVNTPCDSRLSRVVYNSATLPTTPPPPLSPQIQLPHLTPNSQSSLTGQERSLLSAMHLERKVAVRVRGLTMIICFRFLLARTDKYAFPLGGHMGLESPPGLVQAFPLPGKFCPFPRRSSLAQVFRHANYTST